MQTIIQSVDNATFLSVVKDVGAGTYGAQALYRGIYPAAGGAFFSHGIRTCAYEAVLMVTTSMGMAYHMAQPIAAGVGTFGGTLVRIPCEVLKQQLQRNNYPNVKVWPKYTAWHLQSELDFGMKEHAPCTT